MNKVEMPKLLRELVTMVNRMYPSEEWKRWRIAVTQEEWNEIRDYYSVNSSFAPIAVMAIRGVPLYIEQHPLEPLYLMEAP